MWDKIKEIVSLIFGSRLVVEGTGRTFVKVPMWLAVLACVASIRLAVLTALLVVLFGMRVRVVKAGGGMSMDFETIKNNAVNAFRQLSVLRVIVTSPNEKVADVPALYALAALLLAPWVCAAALVLGFLFKYGIRFEKDAVKMN